MYIYAEWFGYLVFLITEKECFGIILNYEVFLNKFNIIYFNPFRNKSGAQTYGTKLGSYVLQNKKRNIFLSKIKDRSQLLQTICYSYSIEHFFVGWIPQSHFWENNFCIKYYISRRYSKLFHGIAPTLREIIKIHKQFAMKIIYLL